LEAGAPIAKLIEPFDPFTKMAVLTQSNSSAESLTAPTVVLVRLKAGGQVGPCCQSPATRSELSSNIQRA
jgi:hypothetical protein